MRNSYLASASSTATWITHLIMLIGLIGLCSPKLCAQYFSITDGVTPPDNAPGAPARLHIRSRGSRSQHV